MNLRNKEASLYRKEQGMDEAFGVSSEPENFRENPVMWTVFGKEELAEYTLRSTLK